VGNGFMKKIPPASPLQDPSTGKPYPVPQCQNEWQQVVDLIAAHYELPCPVIVARDGLRVIC
jgi:hypothetical protein